jgi:hypothetical protein
MTDFFIHIPRSGGSSLRTLLHLNYRPEKIVSMSGDHQQILDYTCSAKEDREKHQLVQGHFPFGLHLDLDVFRYFALIRDPVERHFSEFFYAAKYPEHPGHERIKSGELTLDLWATIGESHNFYHQNTLCQFLSGEFIINKPTHVTFQAACSNLERMTIIGITERFTESALIMSKYLGWQKPIFGIRNRIERKDVVPPHLVRTAEKNQELDLALYEFAKDLFQKRIDQEAKVYFPALEAYEEKVQAVGIKESMHHERYRVEEKPSDVLFNVNHLEAGSVILDYLNSDKQKELFSGIPYRPLAPDLVATYFKCLLTSLVFGEIRIYNREKVRSHWFGVIDVSEFPTLKHETLGAFRVESDFSARFPFVFQFAHQEIGVIKTSPWMFPNAIRESDDAEIRFMGLESDCPKIEIKEDAHWTLLAELPVVGAG